MKAGYKESAVKAAKSLEKGYAKPVKVVNTPTVKIEHEPHKPMLPTLRLSSKNLPEIKKWKVGGKYTLMLEVEQTSMHQGNDYELSYSESDKKDEISASFKITKVSSK